MVEVVNLDSDEEPDNHSLYISMVDDVRQLIPRTALFSQFFANLDAVKHTCPNSYLLSSKFKQHIENCTRGLNQENVVRRLKTFAHDMVSETNAASQHLQSEQRLQSERPQKRRKLDPPRAEIIEEAQIINDIQPPYRQPPSHKSKILAPSRGASPVVIDLDFEGRRLEPSRAEIIEGITKYSLPANSLPPRVLAAVVLPPVMLVRQGSSNSSASHATHSRPQPQTAYNTIPVQIISNIPSAAERTSSSPLTPPQDNSSHFEKIVDNLTSIQTKFSDEVDVQEVMRIFIHHILSLHLDKKNVSLASIDTYCSMLLNVQSPLSLLYHLRRLLMMKYFMDINPVEIKPGDWFSAHYQIVPYHLSEYVMFAIFIRLLAKVLPETKVKMLKLFQQKFRSALHGVKRTALDRIKKVELTENELTLNKKSYAARILCCLGDCMELFIKSKIAAPSKESSRGTSPVVKETSRRTSPVVKDTSRGTSTVVKETSRGTSPVVKETSRGTSPVVKETSRGTSPVVKETSRGTSPVVKETSRGTSPVVKETSRGTSPVVKETCLGTSTVVSENLCESSSRTPISIPRDKKATSPSAAKSSSNVSSPLIDQDFIPFPTNIDATDQSENSKSGCDSNDLSDTESFKSAQETSSESVEDIGDIPEIASDKKDEDESEKNATTEEPQEIYPDKIENSSEGKSDKTERKKDSGKYEETEDHDEKNTEEERNSLSNNVQNLDRDDLLKYSCIIATIETNQQGIPTSSDSKLLSAIEIEADNSSSDKSLISDSVRIDDDNMHDLGTETSPPVKAVENIPAPENFSCELSGMEQEIKQKRQKSTSESLEIIEPNDGDQIDNVVVSDSPISINRKTGCGESLTITGASTSEDETRKEVEEEEECNPVIFTVGQISNPTKQETVGGSTPVSDSLEIIEPPVEDKREEIVGQTNSDPDCGDSLTIINDVEVSTSTEESRLEAEEESSDSVIFIVGQSTNPAKQTAVERAEVYPNDLNMPSRQSLVEKEDISNDEMEISDERPERHTPISLSQKSIEFIEETSRDCMITSVKPGNVQYVEIKLGPVQNKAHEVSSRPDYVMPCETPSDMKQDENKTESTDTFSNIFFPNPSKRISSQYLNPEQPKRLSLESLNPEQPKRLSLQSLNPEQPKRLSLQSLNSPQPDKNKEPEKKRVSLKPAGPAVTGFKIPACFKMDAQPSSSRITVVSDSDDSEPKKESESEDDPDPEVDEESEDYKQKVAQVEKLSRKLVRLARRIKAVQEADIDCEEMDKWGNLYLQEEKLKKKHRKVLQKLEEVQGDLNCHYYFNVKVNCGIPVLSQYIEERLNARQKFPDIQDVRRLIERGLKECKISMKDKKVKTLAKQVFLDAGSQIQTHRKTELKLDGGFHLMDQVDITKDPAKEDAMLRKKLKRNKTDARRKLQTIQSTFDAKQLERELLDNDIFDDEAGSDDDNKDKDKLEEGNKDQDKNKDKKDGAIQQLNKKAEDKSDSESENSEEEKSESESEESEKDDDDENDNDNDDDDD